MNITRFLKKNAVFLVVLLLIIILFLTLFVKKESFQQVFRPLGTPLVSVNWCKKWGTYLGDGYEQAYCYQKPICVNGFTYVSKQLLESNQVKDINHPLHKFYKKDYAEHYCVDLTTVPVVDDRFKNRDSCYSRPMRNTTRLWDDNTKKCYKFTNVPYAVKKDLRSPYGVADTAFFDLKLGHVKGSPRIGYGTNPYETSHSGDMVDYEQLKLVSGQSINDLRLAYGPPPISFVNNRSYRELVRGITRVIGQWSFRNNYSPPDCGTRC